MRMRVQRTKLVAAIKKQIEDEKLRLAKSKAEFPKEFDAYRGGAIAALEQVTERVRRASTVRQIECLVGNLDRSDGTPHLPPEPKQHSLDKHRLARLRCALEKLELCCEDSVLVDDRKDSYLQSACSIMVED